MLKSDGGTRETDSPLTPKTNGPRKKVRRYKATGKRRKEETGNGKKKEEGEGEKTPAASLETQKN